MISSDSEKKKRARSDVVLHTSYHDTVNDLQEHSFANAGPFASPEWFALLEEAGHQPFIVFSQYDDSTVALILERSAQDARQLQALTNWYAFTWQPLMSGKTSDALLDAAVAALRGKAGWINLTKLTPEMLKSLRTAFIRAGWATMVEPEDVNHILHIGGRNWAQYLASRPGTLRSTLKRRAKKVSVSIITEFEQDAWHSYEKIYACSWKPQEGDPVLLRRFAQQEGRAGRLRMALARTAEEPVAAQFWTVQDGTAWIHKLAHLESAKHLSPGTTLTAALMEHVVDKDGVKMVDFGTGNDGYKRDWMEQIRPRYRLQCWRPGDPANWLPMMRARLRNLASRRHAG